MEPTFGAGRNGDATGAGAQQVPAFVTRPRNGRQAALQAQGLAGPGMNTITMSTTTDFTAAHHRLDATRLERMVRLALTLALASVLVAMLATAIIGLAPGATLLVVFLAAIAGGLAGGRLAWKRTA